MHELRVLTGLHRGAALPLVGKQWHIGAADDADLALFDPGIRDRHCLIRYSDDGWHVIALEGALKDNEGQSCEQLPQLSPGTPFALSHIWLSIVHAATPWPDEDAPRDDAETQQVATPDNAKPDAPVTAVATPAAARRALPAWAKALYLLLGVLLTLLLGSWMLQDSMASPSAPPVPAKPALASGERARQIVTSMLLDRGLEKSVKLASDADTLTLTGNVSAEESHRLDRMLSTLHQRYNVTVTLQNRTTTLSARLPFRIVQISTGPQANIVTDQGQRMFIGDEVDQLRLVSISNDSIEFAGREQIKVKW